MCFGEITDGIGFPCKNNSMSDLIRDFPRLRALWVNSNQKKLIGIYAINNR
jgi:hypothetical protein